MRTGEESATEQPVAVPRTGWQRASLTAGLVLILAGVGLLGWIGWQMYGTNWVSHRKQAEAIDSLTVEWERGQDLVEVPAGTVSAIVRIPRFGDDYQVPILEGTDDDALAAGFGRYDDSADAGDKGNFSLAGHRITHGEPLRDMPDLEPGDEVVVETREATYTYVLDTGGDDLVVPFTEVWVLDPEPVNPDGGVQPPEGAGPRLLTLTTCSELFHTDDRMIAFGHLVSTDPR